MTVMTWSAEKDRTRLARSGTQGLAERESDSGLFSTGRTRPRDQLWTIAGLPVDGLRAALRRFRKSHHLNAAGCDRHGIPIRA
jgi:hypothetical protein